MRTLNLDRREHERERPTDLVPVTRSHDPSVHKFQREREYVRALNATKLDKVFAKPFVAQLEGHRDSVSAMCKHPTRLNFVLSGGGDGEVCGWNLTTLTRAFTINAHTGEAGGITIAPDANFFFTCGRDQAVKLWRLDDTAQPETTYLADAPLRHMDHHYSDSTFVTCGEGVAVWDHARAEPIHSFSWGADSVHHVRFNRAETNVVASTASDRSIVLYDIRTQSETRKVVLAMRSNGLCWNPMEPFNFTVGNEDHNLYTFDMRRLDHALCIHKDHVSAVMNVDYSPTGREFVSASYDRTIRLFGMSSGHSRDVYHTKRMQRVFSVLYSQDNKYVLSGSDDTNLRVWKARASETLRATAPREQQRQEYYDKLKEKHAHLPEIRRIARHRHLPKAIRAMGKTEKKMLESRRRKFSNVVKHSKEGAVPMQAERKRSIVREEK